MKGTPVSSVTVAGLLARSYQQFGNRPALGSLSYTELGHRTTQIGSALEQLTVRPGDRAILLTRNRNEFVEVEHALFCRGIVRVALSNRLHPREVAHIARDCTPSIAFVDEEWAEQLHTVRHDIPSIRHIVGFGRPAATSAVTMSYDQLLTSAPEPGEKPHSPNPDDIAALLYTSGTTGMPKGAALTQRNWVAMMRNSMVELPDLDETDIVLHVAPLSHFSGYVATTCFARGTAHIVLPRFEPQETLRTIVDHGVTIMPAVPTMINMLVNEAEATGMAAPGLRAIIYGGASIAPAQLARAIRIFGDIFVQFYGLSETPMPLSALSMRAHRFDMDKSVTPRRLGSAGRINPFVELKLMDDGSEVANGDIGEIVVRSDTVMSGYWGHPDATAEMINADGWAATGDLGRFDEDGYLYLVDRKKDMINTGGYNVYPSEIEHVIASLEAVEEVAVVGAPHDQWGETITAFVVSRPGRQLLEDDVRDVCLANLARYKLPRQVTFLDSLPKTGSGKVMRRRLRDPLWSGHDRQV